MSEIVNASESRSAVDMYSSIQGADLETRKTIFNAVNSAEPIADHLGTVLNIRDIIIQNVELENEQTGKIENAPRVILIDDSGAAFAGTSQGMLSAITTLFQIIGEPHTWGESIPMAVVEKKAKRGKMFSIELR